MRHMTILIVLARTPLLTDPGSQDVDNEAPGSVLVLMDKAFGNVLALMDDLEFIEDESVSSTNKKKQDSRRMILNLILLRMQI